MPQPRTCTVIFLASLALAAMTWAADTTTIINTTNDCIEKTVKLYLPNKISPVQISIYRYLTSNLNPRFDCSTVSSYQANCGNEDGFLAAGAVTANLTMMPRCSWDCGTACGTIVTDGSSGLPVELMDFAVDGGESPSLESSPDQTIRSGSAKGSRHQ